MSSPYVADNEGLGSGPYLTMTIDATADKDFSQTDIDSNLTGCMVSDDNEVGMGSAGDKLFGKVVWVSTDLVSGTTRPATCAVQMRGVARFKYRTPVPKFNGPVVLDGNGRVFCSNVGDNYVVAIDTENQTCDVKI